MAAGVNAERPFFDDPQAKSAKPIHFSGSIKYESKDGRLTNKN